MKREHFLIHLEAFGCTLIRHDKKGYSCYRHEENGTKSAVPKASLNEELAPATICRVCKTLRVEVPLEVMEKGIVDFDEQNMPKASDLVRLAQDRTNALPKSEQANEPKGEASATPEGGAA